MLRWQAIAVLLVTAIATCGCTRSHEFPNRPITLVCPWSPGGGTDSVSRQVAKHLETDLGVPVNVINATGGKGVTGHNRGLRARPDGYTLLMATLELNMMHWNGLTDLTYRDAKLLMSLNEDYAALFVHKDAPWQTLQELEDYIQKNPEQLSASGTAAGGAWHLAIAGWMLSAGQEADDVKWIPSQGAAPSLQLLLSKSIDIVCCALPEAEVSYRSG
ncbi:MAG: tripartite tricarboxylate transporter substrate binding protein, partial [Planctomycetales bacterium]|nr:tripartite tricarboxylate transporter substrate binding protein [Planctomycetales bacterium]